ncbi:hypothetical protein LCGC14_3004050 [marine sediment metagenome]|uniref:Uncharacterized protein n=1 Tax=marine sediment metagenome TaxID=412755 RepID=A0A0F8XMT8_9ZZZZ
MTAAERMAAIAKEETLRVATSPVRDDIHWLLKRCELLTKVAELARACRGGANEYDALNAALDALAEWEKSKVVK